MCDWATAFKCSFLTQTTPVPWYGFSCLVPNIDTKYLKQVQTHKHLNTHRQTHAPPHVYSLMQKELVHEHMHDHKGHGDIHTYTSTQIHIYLHWYYIFALPRECFVFLILLSCNHAYPVPGSLGTLISYGPSFWSVEIHTYWPPSPCVKHVCNALYVV